MSNIMKENVFSTSKGTAALFFIQIFSTLSYSVLYSTLILYIIRVLHFNDNLANNLTGSFIALNYFLLLIGGYIGGRFLSYRGLFSLSMLVQILGCLLISIPNTQSLYWGLAFFLGGSGLNLTCINCMVTQLFEPTDKRREKVFLWNYSGMNLGFLIGFSIGGYFHLTQNYQTLFILSAIGNLIAIILTLLNWKKLGDRSTPYSEMNINQRKKKQLIGFLAVIALILTIKFLLKESKLCSQLISMIGLSMIVLLFIIALKQKTNEKNKIFAFIILGSSSLVFWTLYQLAPMGLNLFIDRNVDRHFFGMLIAPQWVQNINTFIIIIGGPVLAIGFNKLRRIGFVIPIPLQFSIALILIGIGFAILPLGILNADANGYVAFAWVVTCYVLQSLGELFISPIGYAMVGELAPIRLRGIMMGMWMMVAGIAATLSNHYSQLALGEGISTNPLLTNQGYSETFGKLGWTAIGFGILLLILKSFIIRLTDETKKINVVKNLNDKIVINS